MENRNLKQQYEIGIVGLSVMARNLLLNMANHDFSVAGYDNIPAQGCNTCLVKMLPFS